MTSWPVQVVLIPPPSLPLSLPLSLPSPLQDGKPLKRLDRHGLVLDGSFRLTKKELCEGGGKEGGGVVLMMDHRQDPAFQMEGGKGRRGREGRKGKEE